jgi:threonine/homoserine/homoserine lactone efflux protein
MEPIIIFFVTCIVSFVGSLQVGPVNLFVLNTSIHHKRAALWIAIGGCIPEFVYSALAVYTGDYLTKNATLFLVLKLVMIVLLLILAVLYFLKKVDKITEIETLETTPKAIHSFFKGLTLGILNPQLLPFWLFISVYYDSFLLLKLTSNIHKFAYIMGAAFGAFFLLLLIITFIDKYKSELVHYLNNSYYYKILSLVFLAIAAQQLVSIL